MLLEHDNKVKITCNNNLFIKPVLRSSENFKEFYTIVLRAYWIFPA